MSESEVTMTGTLTRGDDTSISSASSSTSLSPESSAPRPPSRVSQNTLTSKPAIAEKPKIPAKPAHIRPGLKPVQIPNVDDKLGLKPRKPPRRNHSISPVAARSQYESEYEDSSFCARKQKAQKSVYSTKSGSKSFDELDDILSDKPKKQSSKRRGRRTMSTISGTDLQKARERRNLELDTSRGTCQDCDVSDCQRCVLDTISNRTLTTDDPLRERHISQKQYKRKIRRESAGQPSGYSTLDLRTEKKLTNGHDKTRGCTKIVSKTTYKLKKFNGTHAQSELDSAGEESYERQGTGLELMEIPLSPTHYDQPGTPDHDPPSAWQAESAIHSVLSFLRSEYNPRQRSVETETEPWMLLSLDRSEWPADNVDTCDQGTSTRPEITAGRKLPDLPTDAEVVTNMTSGVSSDDDDSCNEVILRHQAPSTSDSASADIYQTIGDDDSEEDVKTESESIQTSVNSDKSQNILSPFDEQEEWSKISKILNSFGADIGNQTESSNNTKDASTPNNSPVYDYPTLKRREKLAATVSEWLRYINMEKYTTNFEGNGYDNINFLGGGVLTKEDLHDIGITDNKDCSVLIDSLRDRSNDFDFDSNQHPKNSLVTTKMEEWLKKIHLEEYIENFNDNLMTDMDRIIDVWDEELVSILEIDRIGHRKRILLSVAGPAGLKKRCGKVDTIRRKSVDKSKEKHKKDNVPKTLDLSKKSSPDEGVRSGQSESDVSVSASYSGENLLMIMLEHSKL